MQVELETASGLERRLTITIPSEKIEGEINKRLQDLSKRVRLDGFRPGKVPMKVVKRRYGEGARQEVLVHEAIKNEIVVKVGPKLIYLGPNRPLVFPLKGRNGVEVLEVDLDSLHVGVKSSHHAPLLSTIGYEVSERVGFNPLEALSFFAPSQKGYAAFWPLTWLPPHQSPYLCKCRKRQTYRSRLPFRRKCRTFLLP